MILATHSKMAEEIEEWSSRLRFTGACQTGNETPNELDLSHNLDESSDLPFEGIKQKRRMLEKRVSFPSDETQLVQNLEPTVPDVPGILRLLCIVTFRIINFFKIISECILTEEESDINIVAAYTSSCKKNEAEPVEHIIEQLKVIGYKPIKWKKIYANLFPFWMLDFGLEPSTLGQPHVARTQLEFP